MSLLTLGIEPSEPLALPDPWRTTEEEREGFFEMSLDMMCIATFDGYFTRLNAMWEQTLGWTREELMAEQWLSFVHPDDVDATHAAGSQLRVGVKVIAFENRYRCKDGSYRWLQWKSMPMVERQVIYAVARDVTPQRAAERALRDVTDAAQKQMMVNDRMASVGTLAAGVAHEINNPLSCVTANLDMIIEEIRLLSGGSSSGRMKELEEMAKDARAGAERVRKIVRGLKTFSRSDASRREATDLRKVLELSINMAFNEISGRAHLVKNYGDVPLVDGDDARLGQVFVNLLVNAAHAFTRQDVEKNEIRILTTTDESGRVVIEVTDNGPGISQDVVGRIFDPFFTTKPIGIGTGLGLSICHSIVTNLHGEISVQSELGVGTTFRVVLPSSSVVPVKVAKSVPPDATPNGRARILVVDDDESVGKVLNRVLAREHEVVVVKRAAAALEQLRAGQTFHLILCDLMMPEMSGAELHAEMLESFPDHVERIIFVTGGAFSPSSQLFLDTVPNERLEKPFDTRNLMAVVQRFIRHTA